MNITQEKINDLNAVVKIKISPEDYTEKVDKSIREQAKKANLPGFRKGMVPAAHTSKRCMAEAFWWKKSIPC